MISIINTQIEYTRYKNIPIYLYTFRNINEENESHINLEANQLNRMLDLILIPNLFLVILSRY